MILASNRQIAEKVCFVKGHKIVSFLIKHTFEPSTKTLMPVYEVICEQCGLELKKIRNYRPYISREDCMKRKKEREANGNSTKS